MNEQAPVKNRLKKLNDDPQAVMAFAPAPGGPAPPPPPPPSTIQISYPTPTVLVCPVPFQAVGTAAQTTQMDQTALIYTPTGILVGTRDAIPPRPFTWSYTFTGALPQGVPLAVVVSGITNGGAGVRDQAVAPFECQ
jgi:hypothetical protein